MYFSFVINWVFAVSTYVSPYLGSERNNILITFSAHVLVYMNYFL